MKAKHTPGPWQAETAATCGSDGNVRITEWFVRRDGDSMAIANDITDPETEEISEANARLIAAAPDLLEACQQWISERDNPSPCLVMKQQAEKKIRAAISKAKGGDQ